MKTEFKPDESEGLPVPKTKNYRHLHNQVIARPGASDRLASLREETLDEIGLFELRKALGCRRPTWPRGSPSARQPCPNSNARRI